ncbi:hypothetical protein [Halovivax gelatinilyticus]|uniref:hypothetical protein n=1 Tax=Halovivax gelatinilyticus TaxID=2961597 RepID=UPI0020CA6444|nr:hypothetical protein [Halovivax gelatinilyticus]
MASEPRDDATVSISLPPEVAEWVDERADHHGESTAEVCRRLVVATHTVATDETDLNLVTERNLESVAADIDEQRREFVSHVEDVRERVVQVKRDVDTKAPSGHEHDEYATKDALQSVAQELSTLESELESVASRADEGFENFESVLEHAVDELDSLGARSATLARAILELREWRTDVAAAEQRRAATDAIKLTANHRGVRDADCEECSASVDVSLLTRPACPHCGATIVDVERRSSILRPHRLVVGDRPALPDSSESTRPDETLLEAAENDGFDLDSEAPDDG